MRLGGSEACDVEVFDDPTTLDLMSDQLPGGSAGQTAIESLMRATTVSIATQRSVYALLGSIAVRNCPTPAVIARQSP